MSLPPPLMAVLPDEPAWRLARLVLGLTAFGVVLAWGLQWQDALVQAVSPVLTQLCDAVSPSGADLSACVNKLDSATGPAVVAVLLLAAGVVLRRALALRVPEPPAVLIWDGRLWSFGVSPSLAATEALTWPRMEGVVPRVQLDLGGWMLLKIEASPDEAGRPGASSRLLARRPRGLWRAVSRRGVADAWTTLRAALETVR